RPGASTRWKADLGAGALELAFGGGRGELRIAARTGTGRVRRLELGGRNLSGVEFRQRLGYDRRRPLAFDLCPGPGGGPPPPRGVAWGGEGASGRGARGRWPTRDRIPGPSSPTSTRAPSCKPSTEPDPCRRARRMALDPRARPATEDVARCLFPTTTSTSP